MRGMVVDDRNGPTGPMGMPEPPFRIRRSSSSRSSCICSSSEKLVRSESESKEMFDKGVWNISVVPEEPGGCTAPDVMPSVSSCGRRVALTGGGTTTSESRGDGGVEEEGVIEKPAAKGGEISRSSGGGEMLSGFERSLRGVPFERRSMGVTGPDTHGTTFVTTFERKDFD